MLVCKNSCNFYFKFMIWFTTLYCNQVHWDCILCCDSLYCDIGYTYYWLRSSANSENHEFRWLKLYTFYVKPLEYNFLHCYCTWQQKYIIFNAQTLDKYQERFCINKNSSWWYLVHNSALTKFCSVIWHKILLYKE